HDYLHQWLHLRGEFLHRLLDSEKAPTTEICPGCLERPALWRCKDCLGQPVECDVCCVDRHCHLPFHRVEKWQGDFYGPAWLRDAGLKLHLGHGGNPCPCASAVTPENPTSSSSNENDSRGQYYDLAEEEAELADEPENETSNPDELHFFTSFAPESSCDRDGNPLLLLINSSGAHQLNVVWCTCQTAKTHAMQLFDIGLLPSSFKAPRTAFSFRALDEFYLANVECKMTAYHYYLLIRRRTSNAFPHAVPNRYRELLRVSRQWADLKARKWAGDGYEDYEDSPGSLATPSFCPTCPQPTHNLPENWKENRDPRRWIYYRFFNGDGNMKLTMGPMKKPENDVALSDGQGYMSNEEVYRKHVADAMTRYDPKTGDVTADQNKKGRRNAHFTGVGAVSCSHGFFFPASVVNFLVSEQQMYMDFAYNSAFCYRMEGIEDAVILYDIICQYGVHFLKRLLEGKYLRNVPDELTIRHAIGLFHVHGHVDGCIPKFSPTYMIGGRQINGEVIETLWSDLNGAARSTGGMTVSHRRENLDSHISDSNWKKKVKSTSTLKRKYREGKLGLAAAEEEWRRVQHATRPEDAESWSTQEIEALQNREEDRDGMLIYNSMGIKPPSRAQILLELNEKEEMAGEMTGRASWIAAGMKIQEAQLLLAAYVRRLGKSPSTAEKNDLTDRRWRLKTRIDALSRSMSEAIGITSEISESILGYDGFQGSEFDEVTGDDVEGVQPYHGDGPGYARGDGNGYARGQRIQIENQQLPLPSSFGKKWREDADLGDAVADEISLRKGQANDALENLRMALAHKATTYRVDIRPAKSQAEMQKAWRALNQVENSVQQQARIYTKARFSLIRLGADPTTLAKYRLLVPADMRVETALVDLHARGNRDAN
ncbi:hypothetical protein DENSPDRAFT_785705, partial [Dentipellis sp. KUC8613]